jgi:hypothetical protein
MPSAVSSSVRGGISLGLRTPSEVMQHHAFAALEAAASENDGVGTNRLLDRACGYGHPGDTAVLDDEFLGRALMEDCDAGLAGGVRQGAHERRAAADRLNARGPFAR